MYSTAETATAETATGEDLREHLCNKINEAIGSNEQSRKVGNIVSNIFTKELEKKVLKFGDAEVPEIVPPEHSQKTVHL